MKSKIFKPIEHKFEEVRNDIIEKDGKINVDKIIYDTEITELYQAISIILPRHLIIGNKLYLVNEDETFPINETKNHPNI